jgi:putative lipoprotein
MRRSFFLMPLLALALGCTDRIPAPMSGVSGQVTGMVTYLERIVLPPDATVTVTLADVSGTDDAVYAVAEQTITPTGQVPIPFSIAYDPAAIDTARVYAVRAVIRDSTGAVRWTTVELYPIITHGNPSEGVEVVLHMPSEPITQAFTCGSLRLTATFQDMSVQLQLPDRTVMLPNVVAASGARYRSGGVEFWNKGAEATLVMDGTTYPTCVAAAP